MPESPRWERESSTGELVCQHGTASDVHCCNCHSGFLFDASACTCGSDEAREVLDALRELEAHGLLLIEVDDVAHRGRRRRRGALHPDGEGDRGARVRGRSA
jgi:hypothetical protein